MFHEWRERTRTSADLPFLIRLRSERMKGPGVWKVQKVGVPGTAMFAGLIGLVWGVLAGIILFASYIQGYLAEGNATLLQSGAAGLVIMAGYGVLGGVIGGAIIASLYNRVLGARYGIEVELGAR